MRFGLCAANALRTTAGSEKMDFVQIEILGFVAGATNLCSSVPQLLSNLRNPQLARSQSMSRNCLQCAGNGLWLLYGASTGSLSMTTFAALGCGMAGLLVRQTRQAQRGSLPNSRPAQMPLAPLA